MCPGGAFLCTHLPNELVGFLDVVGHFVTARAVDVEALERRLEDVERVEVVCCESADAGARRVDLAETAISSAARVGNVNGVAIGVIGTGEDRFRQRVRRPGGGERTSARKTRRNRRARADEAVRIAVERVFREGTCALVDGVSRLIADAEHRVAAAVGVQLAIVDQRGQDLRGETPPLVKVAAYPVEVRRGPEGGGEQVLLRRGISVDRRPDRVGVLRVHRGLVKRAGRRRQGGRRREGRSLFPKVLI